jgi:hypothetical protein
VSQHAEFAHGQQRTTARQGFLRSKLIVDAGDQLDKLLFAANFNCRAGGTTATAVQTTSLLLLAAPAWTRFIAASAFAAPHRH